MCELRFGDLQMFLFVYAHYKFSVSGASSIS